MSLSNLIRRKSGPVGFAAQRQNKSGTVATVATNVCAAEASRWWLIHFPDRDPLEVSFSPPATHAEVLERYPDAVAAEPADNANKLLRKAAAVAGLKLAPVGTPSTPLTVDEEAAVRAWLALIEENEAEIVAAVIEKCQRDSDARSYFLERARLELPKHDPDDRRICSQCANLAGRLCLAARRGEIVASRSYKPIRNLPRRCEGYAPGATDVDRRPGRERWPRLMGGNNGKDNC